ncbi:MAG: transcription initiation factor IIB family protein [Haloferacaceae archaeon]
MQPTGSRTTETNRAAESQRTESDPLVCPECGDSGVTDEGRGETVCRECGMVLEEGMVDHGPEWRAFTSAEREDRRRVGAPQTERMHDRGLSSVISYRDADASGRSLSSRQREKMRRLRTWDERFRTKDAHERNLKQALSEVDRMGSALGLPKTVRETAGVVYRRALEEDLLPGRSIEAMATASLYAAARQAGTPRSLDECAQVSRVERQEFARAYRYLTQELGLALQPADPESYLPRFVSALDVSGETERRARALLDTSKAAGVHSGKSPVGLTAAAIYAGSLLENDPITQARISEVTEVSEVTIRNRYREMLEAAGETGAIA